MSTTNWNNVRQAVYVLGAGVLGAAAAMGWITADQGEQFTSALTQVLGAVALILAAANTNKGDKTGREPAPTLTPATGGELPVYDGPTSTPEYAGRHRMEG